MNKICAIIPARKGSKGIPFKNRSLLAGIPLIVYTIKAALQSGIFSEIFVSSDDNEIISIAESFGLNTVVRGPELSTDVTGLEPVVSNVLEKYPNFKYFCLLQPTSPLRNENHIKEAWSILINSNCDSLISVSEDHSTPLKSMILNEDGFMEGIRNNQFPFVSRQLLPKCFKPNGAIYIQLIDIFLNSKCFLTSRTIPYLMDINVSVDIDSIDDLRLAELYLHK